MPLWFLFALGCALLTAGSDAVSKRILEGNDEWVTGALLTGAALVWLTPLTGYMELKPVTAEFAVLMAVVYPLEIGTYYLFLSAIRMAPLSLTLPLLAFTPVCTIATGWILLGERVSLPAGIGIGLVTLGAYVLNGDLARQGTLAPVAALFSNPGSRRMMGVAFLWSVTGALGKKGILLIGPLPFGLSIILGDAVILAVIALLRVSTGRGTISLGGRTPLLVVLGGVLMAGAVITHMEAMSRAPVAYMLAVKRLSLVFGVILGWLVFNERNISYRLTGASVMVTGVCLLYD